MTRCALQAGLMPKQLATSLDIPVSLQNELEIEVLTQPILATRLRQKGVEQIMDMRHTALRRLQQNLLAVTWDH